jgi:hypothetical protein
MTFAEKSEIFFFLVLVVCSRGELGWGRRRRNMGGEGRQSGQLLSFADGITDELLLSVILSAILTVNRSRDCTEIPI